jgi:hypothetical protein
MHRVEDCRVEANLAGRGTAELESVPAIDSGHRVAGYRSSDGNCGAGDRAMCLRITDDAVPRDTGSPTAKEIPPIRGACQVQVADPLPIDERLVTADRNDRCVATHGDGQMTHFESYYETAGQTNSSSCACRGVLVSSAT